MNETPHNSTCNTESEPPWVESLKSLLCSFSPIPKGSRYSGVRFNAMTRLIIYITVLLAVCKVKTWPIFLAAGIAMLCILKIMGKQSLRENFALLSPPIPKENMEDYKSLTYQSITNQPNGKSLITPYTSLAMSPAKQVAQINSIENQRRLAGSQTANITNTYGLQDYVDNVTNIRNEPGKRDPQAGIQYFTPYVGVNRKTMIAPIIGPRITDQDYWGNQATVRSDINKLQVVDVTNEQINVSDMAEMPRRFPYAQPDGVGRVQYPLALPVKYDSRVPNAVWNMNPVGQDPDIGYWPSSETMWNSQSSIDYDANVLPIYKNADSYPNYSIDSMLQTTTLPGLNTNSTPNYQAYMQPNTWQPPVDTVGVTNNMALQQMGVPIKEGFYFVDTNTVPINTVSSVVPSVAPGSDLVGNGAATPVVTPNAPADSQPMARPLPTTVNQPGPSPPPQMQTYYGQQPVQPLVQMFNNEGARGVLGGQYTELSRVPPGQNIQIPAVTDQLMVQSPVYSFTDDYFKQPNTKLFMREMQPNLYSYTVDQTPINSSVGISYAPQNPPVVLDQITNAGLSRPLYSRIDPQLVRKDGTPGQQASQPERTDWSADYSNFQAAPGSVNFEDIYNPTFTSYGDPYRSYSDVNLGSVSYYYSDIDAYRMPNFISRSNTDFVTFRNPNGEVWPEYNRTASMDDVRAHVENQTTADELFHREDLTSKLMQKSDRINYQRRFAPLRNGFHGGFGYGSSM